MKRNVDSSEQGNLFWFRVLTVLALIASMLITWPLWSVRQHPPLLPAVDLPQVAIGAPLVAASLAALLAPRPGMIAVSLLMAYGMVADQTRMQPEFISLPILLWGTLASPAARLVARAHLVALWFYAGLHKLVSPDYLADAGSRLAHWLPNGVSPVVLAVLAVAIAILELSMAAAALIPGTRKLAAWLVLVVHAGILLTLSPLFEGRNMSVWPWNLVLAASGFALIAPWRSRLLPELSRVTLAPRLVATAFLIVPLGFYAGIVDAYVAHHLYSAGTARATVYCPAGCNPGQDLNATWHALEVPLPPEPRLFSETFARTCAPGDVLRIDDPFPAPWIHAGERQVLWCPAGSLPVAHP